MLSARGLGFTYQGRRSPALEGLDLEVGPGELVLLAGPSGGGKTTAALGLAGLLGDPVSGRATGEVHLEGEPILGRGASAVAGRVSLVQQDPESHLCTLTVEDEVAFGPENMALPREEIAQRVEAAMARVGIQHLRGRGTHELSGGEKQRLAIASVLSLDPSVLVMDEPTANLDPTGRAQVLDLALDLAAGVDRSVVVVEHRLDRLALRAREVVVLSEGRVAWRGAPDDMMAEAEAVSRLGVRVPDRPDLMGLERGEGRPGEAVLRVSGLRAGYDGREVLGGVDLEVRAGETVALLGPNGGGKTTLLRCIMGLEEAWEGRLDIAGLDATAERTSTLARRAGLIFQTPDHQLFGRTVADEMWFGPRNLGLPEAATAPRVARLAASYGLGNLLDVHPFRLSLGQKRRLNVASVQVSSPRLLVLDEPFIGQDIGSIRALAARLRDAREEGTAILVVSHDLEVLARIADRAMLLDGGRTRELRDVASLDEGTAPWGDAR